MANNNKKKADPLSPFKRAITLATRTLAANKSMNVVFGSDAPGYDGKTVRLKPSPALGGDSAEVLENWLGIDTGEFANLKSAGVL